MLLRVRKKPPLKLNKKLINPREYAKRKGMHPATVYRKIKTGEITAERVTVEVWRIPVFDDEPDAD